MMTKNAARTTTYHREEQCDGTDRLGERLARSLGVEPILYKELSHAIVGAAIEVHRRIGPGMVEQVYQRALEYELGYRAIPFVAQAPIAVRYRDRVKVGEFFADFIVDDELPIDDEVGDELAHVLAPVHEADRDMGHERDAAEPELGFERPLIRVLEHAGPEAPMHFDRSADDGMRELLVDDQPAAKRLLESSLELVIAVISAFVAALGIMIAIVDGGLVCVILGHHRGAPFSP
jgi:GxxExxY protein